MGQLEILAELAKKLEESALAGNSSRVDTNALLAYLHAREQFDGDPTIVPKPKCLRQNVNLDGVWYCPGTKKDIKSMDRPQNCGDKNCPCAYLPGVIKLMEDVPNRLRPAKYRVE